MAEDLETQIYSLSDRQKAVFAGLVCERLLPQYEAFVKAAGWGSPVVCERVVELLYNSALLEFVPQEAEALLEKLELVMPDLDEFEQTLASYALDACSALEQGLMFLIDKDETHIQYCATAARDSIDMFVQDLLDLDPNRRDLDAIIDAHPFMQAEVARQHRLIEALLSIHEFDAAGIHQLRRLNGSGSIVDLSLIPA